MKNLKHFLSFLKRVDLKYWVMSFISLIIFISYGLIGNVSIKIIDHNVVNSIVLLAILSAIQIVTIIAPICFVLIEFLTDIYYKSELKKASKY